MITGFLLQIFYSLLYFFAARLPAIAFPAAITGAIQTIWYYINAVSFLLPVSTILIVLGLAMVFHSVILVWRLGNYIAGYVRGK